jgi:hypothetical protein
MKITNIPNEVYLAAIDYEGYDRPKNLDEARLYYKSETYRSGFTNLGLEKAICDYLLRTGLFDEGCEFEEIDGYTKT